MSEMYIELMALRSSAMRWNSLAAIPDL